MDIRERRLLREIIKQVHPDVLGKRPAEQAHNTEALKVVADLELYASEHTDKQVMFCRCCVDTQHIC